MICKCYKCGLEFTSTEFMMYCQPCVHGVTKMTSAELRTWIARMGFSRSEAAAALGLTKRTIDGHLSPTHPTPVSRQTELLCGYVERERAVYRMMPATGSASFQAAWPNRCTAR